jgi:hypothetical protein
VHTIVFRTEKPFSLTESRGEQRLPDLLVASLRVQAGRSTSQWQIGGPFQQQPLELHPALCSALAGASEGFSNPRGPARAFVLERAYGLLSQFDGKARRLSDGELERISVWLAQRVRELARHENGGETAYLLRCETLLDRVANGTASAEQRQELAESAASRPSSRTQAALWSLVSAAGVIAGDGIGGLCDTAANAARALVLSGSRQSYTKDLEGLLVDLGQETSIYAGGVDG